MGVRPKAEKKIASVGAISTFRHPLGKEYSILSNDSKDGADLDVVVAGLVVTRHERYPELCSDSDCEPVTPIGQLRGVFFYIYSFFSFVFLTSSQISALSPTGSHVLKSNCVFSNPSSSSHFAQSLFTGIVRLHVDRNKNNIHLQS